jgi:[acyl-carrier-protein] S-malonyltransferase
MNDTIPTALAFPGMGIRLTGFERALFLRRRETMLPFFEEAGAKASVDLVAALERGTAKDLDDRNSQLFTCAFSSALSDALQNNGIAPQYAAGYSFGLYAALFAVRALTFSQTLACVCFAFDAMRDACKGSTWGMAAIIGLSLLETEKLVRDSLVIVNVNSDACLIVAGLRRDCEALCCRAMEHQAIKAELLPVEIPYHSPDVLAAASQKFRSFLEGLSWNQPVFPLVSSINADLLSGAEGLLDYTARHLCTPISWLKTVGRLHSLGVERIIECGPGVSLSRHGGFMPFEISYVNVKNIEFRCSV